MEGEVALDVGQLFAELGNQLRRNAKVALIALVLLVAGNLALDQLGNTSSALPAGLLTFAVQLYVIREALKSAGALPDGSKVKLWSLWWMNIMSTVAIIAGCVLLIVPGLYLAGRWFVAGPIVIAEDKTAVEALRESWDLTRGSVWHLVAATILLFGGGLGIALVPAMIVPESEQGLSFTAATYVVMFAAYICGWLMEVGAYGLISNRQHGLSEIFA